MRAFFTTYFSKLEVNCFVIFFNLLFYIHGYSYLNQYLPRNITLFLLVSALYELRFKTKLAISIIFLLFYELSLVLLSAINSVLSIQNCPIRAGLLYGIFNIQTIKGAYSVGQHHCKL